MKFLTGLTVSNAVSEASVNIVKSSNEGLDTITQLPGAGGGTGGVVPSMGYTPEITLISLLAVLTAVGVIGFIYLIKEKKKEVKNNV